MPFYFSFQYSAIQKTILRHERLWSIAGISQILSYLNEIRLPEIAQENQGDTIVAGGGKFTAKFRDKKCAEDAKAAIIKEVNTTLPMLEFQASSIKDGNDFKEVKEEILEELDLKKRQFRGCGISFNPHLSVCKECVEYPATQDQKIKDKAVCRVCYKAYEKARLDLSNLNSRPQEKLTTLEKIYKGYINNLQAKQYEIPLDFSDLFPGEDKEGKQIAVWFSDLNNMNQKVPVWLGQEKEEEILETFQKIKEVNIQMITRSLDKTFGKLKTKYLPFRILVAGGDDLCIVMNKDYILDFVLNISESIKEQRDKLDKSHPLNKIWIEEHRNTYLKEQGKPPEEIGPYCFGASFVVTSDHTPFHKIHELGEKLMSQAKIKTERKENSVNWQILSADENSNSLVTMEKPVLIESMQSAKLYFRKYVEMAKFYDKEISHSHRQQIISKIIEYKQDNQKIETWLKKYASSELDKSFSFILLDENFRYNKQFQCSRLCTLIELMNLIKEEKTNG